MPDISGPFGFAAMPPCWSGVTANDGSLSVGKLKFTLNVPADWKNTWNEPITAAVPLAWNHKMYSYELWQYLILWSWMNQLQFHNIVIILNTAGILNMAHAAAAISIPYSGKFSWNQIFADGQSSKISRTRAITPIIHCAIVLISRV